MKSAFLDKVRCSDDYFTVDAPEYHSVAYATGGIGQLYHMIKNDDVPPLPEIGYHTDSNGHFTPKGKCLLGLRYNVVKILDAKGQSAVLVEAEDLFCSNMPVVIKVLHSHYYQLGGQESHILRKLTAADPNNYSHTLRLLTTLTMDTHYCLVFEPMLPDPLTHVFSGIPSSKILADIRRVGLRLLTSLSFLHQQNLIHTDLKPENILLKHEHDLDSVHIVDFGNAINFVHSEVSLYYKDFDLQTPLYRAPEVMYGIPFGPEIDIWSLGCILAELYLGKPLFLGCTQADILKQMFELLGRFPTKLFRRGKYYPSLRTYTSEENQDVCTFKLMEFMQCNDYNFADLISGMLRYNPEERLTASQAARHPFFASHLPLGFLFPYSKDGSPYSAVSLTKDTYQLSPYVPSSIKRQPLSSVDLLKQGTNENSNLEKSLMKPSPKLRGFRGDNSCTTTKGSYLFAASRGSNSDGDKKSGYSSPMMKHSNEETRSQPSDVSVVRQFIHGAKKGEKYSENVKDKMSSLLQAIREEQVSVENDLDRRNDVQGMHHHKNRSKHKTPVITLQRPCPRYGKLGQAHRNNDSVQNCGLNSPRIHLLSQNGSNEQLHKESIGTGNSDNYGKECSKNCKTGSDYYEKLDENVLRIQQGAVHKPLPKHSLLPGRFEINRTISNAQNSGHKKSGTVHKEYKQAQSTSYCSESDISMDSDNDSCHSGKEGEYHDSIAVEKSKHEVHSNRNTHTLTPSFKEFPQPIKASPNQQIYKYIDKRESEDAALDDTFDHKQNVFKNFRSSRETYPKDKKVDLMTEPRNQDFAKRTSRKRVASVSVSDDEEYLELLSPPSAMKSDKKKVKSESHTKRRQSLDTACSIENNREYLLKEGKLTAFERMVPSTNVDSDRFINDEYLKNDKTDTIKDKHTEISPNDQRHRSQQKTNENEKYKFQMGARSDLKPSARSHGSRYPSDPLFTPIQKFSPSVTDSIASPEIIYKVADKQAMYGENKCGDDRKRLTYHRRFQDNLSAPTDVKPLSEKQRLSRTGRNSDTKHEYVKAESDEQARSTGKKYTETILKDVKTEVSDHDDFSFRSTPESDYKLYKSEGGIGERIAKINMKHKKPARKSLQFEYSDSDVQPVNRITDVSDTKRNQLSLDYDSELVHAYGSKDFFAEKHRHESRYSYGLTPKQPIISDDRMWESTTGEVHDRVKNTRVNHYVSLESTTANSKREQMLKRAVNSGSDRIKFQRNYIPKNDTTFTIEFESPIH